MFTTAPDHRHRLLAVRRNGGVFAHELGIAQNAVERCTQLVADGADVAALGLIGLVSGGPCPLGHLAGALQFGIGLPVRLDLAHQQMGLPVGLFLRHLTALVGQHHPPSHQTSNQQQGHVGLDKARVQRGMWRQPQSFAGLHGHEPTQLLVVQQTKNAGQQRRNHQHQQQKITQTAVQVGP